MEDQESCQYCGEVFNSAPAKFLHGLHGNTCKLYIDHIEQLDNGTLKCQICTYEFTKEMEAFVHIKKTHSNRKDPVQPKPMVAKNGFIIKTIETKLKTKQNHKLFNTKNNLMVESPKVEDKENHSEEVEIIDISSDEKMEIDSHRCDICGKEMGTQKRLKRHIEDWHRSVICRYCGVEIESSHTCRRNLHNATCLEFKKIVDIKTRKCRLCGDKLPMQIWLHFKENHPQVLTFHEKNYKKPTVLNEKTSMTSTPINGFNGSITIGSTTITPSRPPATNPTIKAKLDILEMCKTPTNTTTEKPSRIGTIKTIATTGKPSACRTIKTNVTTRKPYASGTIKTNATKALLETMTKSTTIQNHLRRKGTDGTKLGEPLRKKPSLENHQLKMCLFCGKMHVDSEISTKFHRKRCKEFRKYGDLIKEKCLICQRPMKNIEKHFRKCHPDLIHISENPKSVSISMDSNQSSTKIADEIPCEDPGKNPDENMIEMLDKNSDKFPDKDMFKMPDEKSDKIPDKNPDEDLDENMDDPDEDSHSKYPDVTEENSDNPKKISDVFYKCPLCKDKFTSEEITKEHLFEYHRFTSEKVSELGLKIKIIT